MKIKKVFLIIILSISFYVNVSASAYTFYGREHNELYTNPDNPSQSGADWCDPQNRYYNSTQFVDYHTTNSPEGITYDIASISINDNVLTLTGWAFNKGKSYECGLGFYKSGSSCVLDDNNPNRYGVEFRLVKNDETANMSHFPEERIFAVTYATESSNWSANVNDLKYYDLTYWNCMRTSKDQVNFEDGKASGGMCTSNDDTRFLRGGFKATLNLSDALENNISTNISYTIYMKVNYPGQNPQYGAWRTIGAWEKVLDSSVETYNNDNDKGAKLEVADVEASVKMVASEGRLIGANGLYCSNNNTGTSDALKSSSKYKTDRTYYLKADSNIARAYRGPANQPYYLNLYPVYIGGFDSGFATTAKTSDKYAYIPATWAEVQGKITIKQKPKQANEPLYCPEGMIGSSEATNGRQLPYFVSEYAVRSVTKELDGSYTLNEISTEYSQLAEIQKNIAEEKVGHEIQESELYTKYIYQEDAKELSLAGFSEESIKSFYEDYKTMYNNGGYQIGEVNTSVGVMGFIDVIPTNSSYNFNPLSKTTQEFVNQTVPVGYNNGVEEIIPNKFSQYEEEPYLYAPIGYYYHFCIADNEPIPLTCDDTTKDAVCNTTDTGTHAVFHENDNLAQCTLDNSKKSGFTIVNTNDSAGLNTNYCEVACKDDLDVQLPGTKFATAGMFFALDNYIPKLTMKRTCVTSNIDYDKFEGDMDTIEAELVNNYNIWQDHYDLWLHFKYENSANSMAASSPSLSPTGADTPTATFDESSLNLGNVTDGDSTGDQECTPENSCCGLYQPQELQKPRKYTSEQARIMTSANYSVGANLPQFDTDGVPVVNDSGEIQFQKVSPDSDEYRKISADHIPTRYNEGDKIPEFETIGESTNYIPVPKTETKADGTTGTKYQTAATQTCELTADALAELERNGVSVVGEAGGTNSAQQREISDLAVSALASSIPDSHANQTIGTHTEGSSVCCHEVCTGSGEDKVCYCCPHSYRYQNWTIYTYNATPNNDLTGISHSTESGYWESGTPCSGGGKTYNTRVHELQSQYYNSTNIAKDNYNNTISNYSRIITNYNKCFDWTDSTDLISYKKPDNYSSSLMPNIHLNCSLGSTTCGAGTVNNRTGTTEDYRLKFYPKVTFNYDDDDMGYFAQAPYEYKDNDVTYSEDFIPYEKNASGSYTDKNGEDYIVKDFNPNSPTLPATDTETTPAPLSTIQVKTSGASVFNPNLEVYTYYWNNRVEGGVDTPIDNEYSMSGSIKKDGEFNGDFTDENYKISRYLYNCTGLGCRLADETTEKRNSSNSRTIPSYIYKSSYIKQEETVSYEYHLPRFARIIPNGTLRKLGTYNGGAVPSLPSEISSRALILDKEAVPINIKTSDSNNPYHYYITVSDLYSNATEEKNKDIRARVHSTSRNENDNITTRIKEKTPKISQFTCDYNVTNDVYVPPCIGPTCDPDEKHGYNLFYRVIDMSNLDPNHRENNHTLGYNWVGYSTKNSPVDEQTKTGKIGNMMEEADADYQLLTTSDDVFEFILTPTMMQSIRSYNAEPSRNYSDWDLICKDYHDSTTLGYHCTSEFLNCLAEGGTPSEYGCSPNTGIAMENGIDTMRLAREALIEKLNGLDGTDTIDYRAGNNTEGLRDRWGTASRSSKTYSSPAEPVDDE